jgi:hypothetical protein
MEIIKHIFDIFDISHRILENSNDVKINFNALQLTANEMGKNPLEEKQKIKKYISPTTGLGRSIVLKELVSDAVNYCFWQFDSSIRPNGSSSTDMRNLLNISFDAKLAMHSDVNFLAQTRNFYRAMMINRYPVMEKRLVHLMALSRPFIMQSETGRHAFYPGRNVAITLVRMIAEDFKFETLFDFLITEIDGYGDDPFLKRASLFFLQLNRIMGLYEDEIKLFPIPADYHIPKMFRHYGILEYSPTLQNKILKSVHLQENGPEEMAIRAGTIVVGKELCDILGWSASDVDWWFFKRRKEVQSSFHLCITSNY